MNEGLDEIKGVRRSLRKKEFSSPTLESGKVPPQALDLEEAVLGALMLEKEAVNSVIDILSPENFYKDSHNRIFSTIQGLFQRSEPIDALTVVQALKQNGELDVVGGAYFISQLTNRVASSANIEFHSRIILQKFILRELIRISSNTITKAYDDTTDVFDLLDSAESDLFSVAEGNIRKNYDKMSSLIQQAIKQIEDSKMNQGGLSGVPTGFYDLDKLTSGWQKSDMIVLAARPGMGKTAFVLSMARNIAVDANQGVAVFSLEMSSLQLVNRLISSETEISAEKIRRGDLADHEFQQLHAKIGKLSEAPLFIDDTPALSIFELRAKCRRLKAQHDIKIIIIDYLQLMTAGGDNKGNREQEISQISRSIKSLAKELEVPIIALSQLSRSVETRGGDKRPMLSDLRESGAIEQDADIVSFIYRPEYYGITEDEEGNSLDGAAYIIIAKHRNGSLDDIKLQFKGQFAKFANPDTYDFSPEASQMTPNGDFEEPVTKTVASKFNDDDDFDDLDFSKGGDAPF